jgi:hypothetical protein
MKLFTLARYIFTAGGEDKYFKLELQEDRNEPQHLLMGSGY